MEEEFNINKVASEVLVKISTLMAEKSWNMLHKYGKDTKNKAEVELGTAYYDYLEYSYENINKVKTLLYKESGRPLYSFYECVGVSFNGQLINTDSIEEIFRLGNFILITGTGGIGKTIMLKHFFLNCINSTTRIPVLVNVRYVNEINISERSLVDIIYDEMKNYHFNLEMEYLVYSLKSGNYLFLLDGFDEINEKYDKWMEKEILKFCKRYPDNYYIMTSRPSERFVGWNNFIELKALSLTKDQAMSMVHKLDYDKIVKREFYKALKNGLYDKYKSFASNPLLLTIMLITFENNAEIPDKLNDFYEQAFLTLFTKHDACKDMYHREIKSKLSYADFKKLFSCFCFLTYLKRRFELKEYEALDFIEQAKKITKLQIDVDGPLYLDDLIHVVCMLIQDGFILSFSHRSFQEYFTVVYISTLPDDDQKELIDIMMKKRYIEVDNILDLLYNQQPERFIKNIIYPTFVEWRKTIDEKENYEEFILTKYSNISCRIENGKPRLSLTVSDIRYICISPFVDKLLSESYYFDNWENVEKSKDKIIDYFMQHKLESLKFDYVRKTEIWADVLIFLSLWTYKLDGVLKYLKEYEEKLNSPKGKFDNYF